MKSPSLMEIYQLLWTLESHGQQRLAWRDAQQAQSARQRAEAQAATQFHAMLNANPDGSLGDAKLNDPDSLKQSGLL